MSKSNDERVPFISVTELCGFVAMWATRQSPYTAPDGLTEVLTEFQKRIQPYLQKTPYSNIFPTVEVSRNNLKIILTNCLLSIPQVQQWNERKNGNKSPYGFTSAFERPNPDDDFIDLDALCMNIARSCIQEEARIHEEHVASTKWTVKKWWNNLLLRFNIGAPCEVIT